MRSEDKTMSRLILMAALFPMVSFMVAASTRAQDGACTPQWVTLFDGGPGLEGDSSTVFAVEVFDDGTGPALFVGGSFTGVGGVAAANIAKFDGKAWAPLGSGVDGWVRDLCVYDDGTGPALFAAGRFSMAGGSEMPIIAKWNGSSWSSVGVPDVDWLYIESLAVGDLGEGPRLFAGEYTTGITAGVAMWDGSAWEKIGGLSWSTTTDEFVGDLIVFDDGSGNALFVVGSFSTAGFGPVVGSASNVAKWDGTQWSAVGTGLNDWARAIAVFDDGSGAALYVGGGFTQAGGLPASGIARWDGATWTPVGTGLALPESGGGVHALLVHDEGTGEALYVGGDYTSAGGALASHLGRWDGLTWSGLDSGMDGPVHALEPHGAGFGMFLYAGGSFTTSAALDGRLARWGHELPQQIPGCFGNTADLSAMSCQAKVGQQFTLKIESGAFPDLPGWAVLYAGADSTDAQGCGTMLPGAGELLLALVPPPQFTAIAPTETGEATFDLEVPRDPAIAGIEVALQAANVPFPFTVVELSTSLIVKVVP